MEIKKVENYRKKRKMKLFGKGLSKNCCVSATVF
jgi:hypothetical protein